MKLVGHCTTIFMLLSVLFFFLSVFFLKGIIILCYYLLTVMLFQIIFLCTTIQKSGVYKIFNVSEISYAHLHCNSFVKKKKSI